MAVASKGTLLMLARRTLGCAVDQPAISSAVINGNDVVQAPHVPHTTRTTPPLHTTTPTPAPLGLPRSAHLATHVVCSGSGGFEVYRW